MKAIYSLFLQSAVSLLLLFILRQVISSLIIRRFIKARFGNTRKTLALKVLNIAFSLATVALLAAIWGVQGSQILTYFVSLLTILGVAFFAQWSLLSNITAGLLLFFNHPLKLGDRISIIDKDFPLEGEIEDITLFFLHVKDAQNRIYTIPNSAIIQKTIRVFDKDDENFRIEKVETLGSEEKEKLFKIWNKEYPQVLNYETLEDFDQYLAQLEKLHYYLLWNPSNELMGALAYFQREQSPWFFILIDEKAQGLGYGRKLVKRLQSQQDSLTAWLIPTNHEKKANGEPYRSPLKFYSKLGFSSLSNSKELLQGVTMVKIQWTK